MSRVLVIPHVLAHGVRIREFEIARALSTRHDVVLLTANKQLPGLSGAGKIRFHAMNLQQRTTESGTLKKTILPRLEFRGRFAREFNHGFLMRFLKSENFNAVINSGYGHDWSIPSKPGRTYILDVVDNHWEGHRLYEGVSAGLKIEQFYQKELTKIDSLVTVSENLRNELKSKWGENSIIIPNGIEARALRSIAPSDQMALRKRLELDGRFVFGYIGGMDGFIDVKLILRSFESVYRKIKNAALLWIGDGEQYRAHRHLNSRFNDTGVLFLGAVPPESSANYVSLFDVGLVPKVVNQFTTAMMPLKLIEYGAARIPVISSPLSEVVRLSLPNVQIAGNQDDWSRMMLALATTRPKWQENWDEIYKEYDWDNVVKKFEALF